MWCSPSAHPGRSDPSTRPLRARWQANEAELNRLHSMNSLAHAGQETLGHARWCVTLPAPARSSTGGAGTAHSKLASDIAIAGIPIDPTATPPVRSRPNRFLAIFISRYEPGCSKKARLNLNRNKQKRPRGPVGPRGRGPLSAETASFTSTSQRAETAFRWRQSRRRAARRILRHPVRSFRPAAKSGLLHSRSSSPRQWEAPDSPSRC
jgi:hypothetical protein